ncbi:MAG: YaiI/YqxD family protein [Acidobacteriota bacterium]
MKIWVDADACPGAIKELIVRTAKRLLIHTVFVANKYISVPDSPHLSTVRIGVELDAADGYIAHHSEAGDIAVTQDIPLSSILVEKGVAVITTRGDVLTEQNVRERLSIRNFMQDLRDAGGVTPGPRQFSSRDKQRFADALDREITRTMKRRA